MSKSKIGGGRMTKKRREAEAAVAAATLADAAPAVSDRRRRHNLEATIRTVSANAEAWQRDGFPNAAGRAWQIVEDCKLRLAALDKDAAQ